MKNLSFFKNKYFWIFTIILAMGIFLRAYNFSPWLHFELDQSRDADLVNKAIEKGAGELPLLGPRAAGTFLRLGPAFYYLEYASAWFFGNNPPGIAAVNLIFSILSIIVFYFFFQKFFSRKISLALTAIFSVSLFFVIYARFAWNPNLLPFFILAFLLTILKATEEKVKAGYWLILVAFIFGLLSQFHFVALIVLGITAIIFWIYKRPRIQIRFYAIALFVLLFLYSPVIINEIKTGGENLRQFIEAVGGKSDKNKHPLLEKAVKNYSENSLKYWIIISGRQTAEIPSVSLEGNNPDIKCDRSCRDNLSEGILAFSFFTMGTLLLLLGIFTKIYAIYQKKQRGQKDFLVLNLILFSTFFLITIPLAFDLSPRFFLIATPLPFLFLGLIFLSLESFLKNKNACLVPTIVLVAFNLFFNFGYFKELKTAISEEYEIATDMILKQKTRITLEQESAIADYIDDFYQNNKYPIFYHGQSEFHRALAYLFDQKSTPRDGINKSNICRQGNYFLVLRTHSNISSYQSYFEKFNLKGKKSFGTLTVFHLEPKDDAINCEAADPEKFRNYKNEGGSVAKRYQWKEIFN